MTVAQVAEYTGQIQRLREANQALEKRNSEVSTYYIIHKKNSICNPPVALERALSDLEK